MTLLIISSLVVAFIAGLAALFAPCCITVLLPAYLGSIFREKYKVLMMTFVFFLGVLAVFLPIGLGVSVLTIVFKRYHDVIFISGGALLVILGLMQLSRKKFSLPFHLNPALEKHNGLSVFALGIFSGVATTCCAPVLAGVLALAALPGSIFWGGLYTLTYVLGMVAPLFLIALSLDKFNFQARAFVLRKPLELNLFKKKITITLAELVSGLMFFGMGILIIYLAFMKQLTVHADYQISLNIYFAQLTKTINNFLQGLFSW